MAKGWEGVWELPTLPGYSLGKWMNCGMLLPPVPVTKGVAALGETCKNHLTCFF